MWCDFFSSVSSKKYRLTDWIISTVNQKRLFYGFWSYHSQQTVSEGGSVLIFFLMYHFVGHLAIWKACSNCSCTYTYYLFWIKNLSNQSDAFFTVQADRRQRILRMNLFICSKARQTCTFIKITSWPFLMHCGLIFGNIWHYCSVGLGFSYQEGGVRRDQFVNNWTLITCMNWAIIFCTFNQQ